MSGYFLNMDTGTDIFYHGSRDGITGKIKPCSRDNCDFGRGFYIGTRYAQAADIATSVVGNNPTIYELKIPENVITNENTLFLTKEDWLLYTLYNRGKLEIIKNTKLYEYYSNLDKGKQFVVGAIVDDSYKDCLEAYLYKGLTDNGYYQIIDSFNYGIQIVAKTNEACDKLQIMTEKTHRLNSSEIEKTRRYGVRVRNDGYGRFITLYDKYEYAEGTTFRDLCRKAQRGYIPKSIKSDDELIAYDNIRFPNQIHDSEEYEYEPFE